MIEEPGSLLAETRAILKRFGLHARKGLGQHFLVDPVAVEKSISAAGLLPDDVVIEVGPGPGVLTERLSRDVGQVIAIEIDPRISSLLSVRFPPPSNVTVIRAGVLDVNVPLLLSEHGVSAGRGYKVVANLPYYIAAPTIRHFLEAEVKPRLMVLMVQREVAESICAAPGKMSLMSVSVRLYGEPSLVYTVGRDAFYPPPKVESAIVRIDVYPRPAVDSDVAEFFRVVKAGFCAPRKQLRNSLAQGLAIEPNLAAAILDKAGIVSRRRAETLTLDEWAGLCAIVKDELSEPGAGN